MAFSWVSGKSDGFLTYGTDGVENYVFPVKSAKKLSIVTSLALIRSCQDLFRKLFIICHIST